MPRARPRSGFTLLEVILVMAILVILMAVALPTLNSMYGDTILRGAADEVRGAWAQARSRSIDTGMNYKFAKKNGSERYRIAPDSQEYWSGSDGEENSDDGKVMNGTLPKGIKFVPAPDAQEDPSGWLTIVTFLPDGTCKDDQDKKDRYVSLKDSSGSLTLVVNVRVLTGSVTVQAKK